MVEDIWVNEPMENAPKNYNQMLDLNQVKKEIPVNALCRCWEGFDLELLGGNVI